MGTIEKLTYAELGARLKMTPRAARDLAKRLKLFRQWSKDRKVLVIVDVAKIKRAQLRPRRSPAAEPAVTAALKATVEALEAELVKLEALQATLPLKAFDRVRYSERPNFERENCRTDSIMDEIFARCDIVGSYRLAGIDRVLIAGVRLVHAMWRLEPTSRGPM